MNQATPHAVSPRRGRDDGGRTILEALIGLSLVALAIVSWSQATVSATRTEAAAEHRSVALELATNELEALTVREWPDAAIDPASPGAVNRFERRNVVFAAGGVPATTTVDRDGRSFEIGRHITDSGDPAWRHAVVVVAWTEGNRATEVRLDGALRRPDTGSGP